MENPNPYISILPKYPYTPEQLFSSKNLLKLEVDYLNGQTAVKQLSHIADLSGDPESLIHVIPSPIFGDNMYRSVFGGQGYLPEQAFTYPGHFVMQSSTCNPIFSEKPNLFVRAGPRRHIYFKPDEVKAAIVTCGGLCPGLNTVIREVVMQLWFSYGVKEIYGIKYGYKGFYSYDWEKLDPKKVSKIHQ